MVLTQVVVFGEWTHDAGAYGHSSSYVVGTFDGIIHMQEWCAKTWKSDFSGVAPIPEQVLIPNALEWMKKHEVHEYDAVVAIDKEAQMYQNVLLHWCKITTISFSYAGQGREMYARLRLKSLLPKELKKYVGLARGVQRRPRHWFVADPYERESYKAIGKTGKMYFKLPKRIRDKPMWELFFEKYVGDEERQLLSQYITEKAFWECATGQVHPDDVDKFFVAPLFRAAGVEFNEIEIRPRAKRSRRSANEHLSKADYKQRSMFDE